MQKHPRGTMTKTNTAKFEISVHFYGNDNRIFNNKKNFQVAFFLLILHQKLWKKKKNFDLI